MESAVFHLVEGTKDWQYKHFILTGIKNHRWILKAGTKSIFFDSIYDALNNLFKKGYYVTFKLPKSMENIPSSCNT